MAPELTCCNDTYTRSSDGVWRYPWGDPVPGAVDLTLADVFAISVGDPSPDDVPMRTLTPRELAWVQGETTELDGVLVRRSTNGSPPGVGDLVVGLLAPELHVLTMLTVADIGELAGVSKATIDSYRYRGYLPRPQATRGRTPLWARPIVRHWLQHRPGCGWRSDLYGTTVDGTVHADPQLAP
jgi:predicted DNA-binding transcriptional regulator AlpA